MIYKYEINKFEKKFYIMTAGDSHIKKCMKTRINRLNRSSSNNDDNNENNTNHDENNNTGNDKRNSNDRNNEKINSNNDIRLHCKNINNKITLYNVIIYVCIPYLIL